MYETPLLSRTDGAIIERIQKRIEGEQIALLKAETQVAIATTRMATLQDILDEILSDAEKNGEAE